MTTNVTVTFDKARKMDWRARALVAETQLQVTREALNTATEHLDGIELRLASRAALISLTREGRKIHFNFVRNGKLHRITALGTWDDDVDQWKKDLLE